LRRDAKEKVDVAGRGQVFSRSERERERERDRERERSCL
jgi:hypothetical protein